jgi:hypothetical protein
MQKLKTTMWRWVYTNQQAKCTNNLKTNEQQIEKTTNCKTTIDVKMTMWKWVCSNEQTKCVDVLKTNEQQTK